MTSTAVALAGLIAWHLALSLLIFGPRVIAFVLRGQAPNRYKPDGQGEAPWVERVCRAHANSFESFPFTGGVLLLALATSQSDVTNGLAMLMLGARVGQSLVHMVSTAIFPVLVRFTFYFVQWALAVYWLFLMVC